MMRAAAQHAGLTASINSNNLILCLEPEGVCFAALGQSLMSTPYLSKSTLPDEENDVDLCDVDYDEIKRQNERGMFFFTLHPLTITTYTYTYTYTCIHILLVRLYIHSYKTNITYS